MARKMADCRRFPSDSNCSLTIIGEEEEVVRTAAEHSVSVHGHEDTSELRDQIRGILEDKARDSTGNSNRIERATILTEPLSLDAHEITDKGSNNQRSVLTNRAALVEDLYASTPAPHVITL